MILSTKAKKVSITLDENIENYSEEYEANF